MRALGILLIVLASMGGASAETLITSLSNHRVLINSNYTGTSIAVFGAIERDAQTVARATAYDVVGFCRKRFVSEFQLLLPEFGDGG